MPCQSLTLLLFRFFLKLQDLNVKKYGVGNSELKMGIKFPGFEALGKGSQTIIPPRNVL
jgi:hypothetical protein